MSKPLVILLLLSSTSVVTFTAGQAPGRSINITVPEMGQFQAIMALYKDSGYTSPYTGADVALSTREFLYVGVFSLGGPSNLVLLMKNCYATPTNNVNDPLKYYFIQNSCINNNDGTITVEENGVSSRGRFSVMFKFAGNYDKVYLHCAVRLCNVHTGSCAPVCALGRSQIDEIGKAQSSDGTLSIGLIRPSGLDPPISIESGSSAINNASPEPCKVDEEWQLRNQQYGCFCKSPYKVTDLSQVVPELTCERYEMKAVFHKCQFNDLNIYFNKTHVKDNICFIFTDDPATNTFSVRVPLQVVGCGDGSYETNHTHATYKAVIAIDVEQRNAIITSSSNLRITLLCFYGLDMITSLQKTLHPIPSPSYNTTMALYKDSNYTTPHTGPEVTLSTEEFLYVGVFILGGDPSNAVLVMKNCYATPTNDADYPVRYYIIQNSCPNIHDGTMSVEENGVSSRGRFSVQMFKSVGSFDEVYLHCAVSLCDITIGSCRPVCSRAKGESVGIPTSFDSSSVLTIGPIRRSGPFSTTAITTPRPFSTTTITTPRPFSNTTLTTPRPFSTTTTTTPRPFSNTTATTTPRPFSTTTITTPHPFSTTTITTPRPLSTTTITTPRPFSTISVTTPRPFSTTTITTPRQFSTTATTTPRPFSTTTITTPRPFSTTTITTPRPFSTTTITTPRPFSTTTNTTPRPFSTNTITTPRPFSTTTITTPRPFSTTTATTPRPFSTTTMTTPRPFSTTTITTPQPSSPTITRPIPTTPSLFSNTTITTPRLFSNTTITTPQPSSSTNTSEIPTSTPSPIPTTPQPIPTTPRPFSTTTITTPKSGSSTINSAHIFWTLLIPALIIQSL